MGKAERRKGQRFERECVDALDKLGFSCRRNLQAQGGEVVGGDLYGLPWAVECCRRKAFQFNILRRKLVQAHEDEASAGSHRPALVMARTDQDSTIYVFLTLSDFVRAVEDVPLSTATDAPSRIEDHESDSLDG